MSSTALGKPSAGITVRPLRESDLAAADRICRVAFGTFLGAPDPEAFFGDRDCCGTRWRADPASVLAAERDGVLVGSNFATRWGSFAFFGPLTIEPALWDQGIAQRLLAATMDLFDAWRVRHAGLFTFANSPKHIHLYQKFGFWPRFLTAAVSKKVAGPRAPVPALLSGMNESRRAEVVNACRALTDSVHEGLDVTREIRAVQEQRLGDTLAIWNSDSLEAFAVCHAGAGTEAGSGSCYIKFAAVLPGERAPQMFERLLDACEGFAASKGLGRMEAGMNLARSGAYRALLGRGYRTDFLGVAMHRPDSPAYHRPDVYVVDDWR